MRRRDFITLVGGTAATWPLVARAQQPTRITRIGWMDFVPESDPATPARVSAFREGMEKQGWVLGRNLAIDYRWSIFDMERARATAEELLNLAPDVMFCAGSPATLALQRATRTVPVVFITVSSSAVSHPSSSAWRRSSSRTVFGTAAKGSRRTKSREVSVRPRRCSRQPMHRQPPSVSIPAAFYTSSRTVFTTVIDMMRRRVCVLAH